MIYAAAFSVQKTKYYFEDQQGNKITKLFDSAKAAKQWLQGDDDMFDDEEETEEVDYVRKSVVHYGTEEQARKRFDELLKKYLKLAGKSIKSYRLFVTGSGHGSKIKVKEGTEQKYQYNRDGMEKPRFHQVIRDHVLSLPETTLSPEGFEADNLLVALGEKHGEKAVVMSLDKDMAQMEHGWFIHVDKNVQGKPVWCTKEGELKYLKSKKKGVGHGFKFLAYQAISGDRADGFHGAKGIGPKKACDFLEDLHDPYEIVEAILLLYQEIYGEEYVYTSWDGVETTRTPTELLNQHFDMVYMERTKSDRFGIYKYL